MGYLIVNTKMIIAVVLCVIVSFTNAYSVNGHLAVANIAQDLLTTNDPTSLQKAIDELKYLQDYDPELVWRGDMYPYIECSTFADDIISRRSLAIRFPLY